jgi:hypothetical protein
MSGFSGGDKMEDKTLVINEAARMFGVSTYTLKRLAYQDLLQTVWVWHGEVRWRHFRIADLRKAPLFTIGRGARLLGVSASTLRTWRKNHHREIRYLFWRNGHRRVSVAILRLFAKEKGLAFRMSKLCRKKKNQQ